MYNERKSVHKIVLMKAELLCEINDVSSLVKHNSTWINQLSFNVQLCMF